MNTNILLPISQYNSNTFQLQLPLEIVTKIDICDPCKCQNRNVGTTFFN